MHISRELLVSGGATLLATLALLTAASGISSGKAIDSAAVQRVELTIETLRISKDTLATGPLNAQTSAGPRRNPWNPQQGITASVVVSLPPPPPLPLPMAPFIPTGDGK